MAQIAKGFGWLFNKREKATTYKTLAEFTSGVNQGAAIYQPNGANEEAPFVAYDVPFQEQKHVNMCGEACAVMLKNFKGMPPAINMDVNPRGVFEGTGGAEYSDGKTTSGTEELANLYGLQIVTAPFRTAEMAAKLTTKHLAKILSDVGPFVCEGTYARLISGPAKVRAGHYIVVAGVWGDNLMMQDPWHGANRVKPITWFAPKLTSNKFAYIA